jgi:hypothetical protein
MIVLRGRARREVRKEDVSEGRFQAKQTNSLRARGPRRLEFRCGPVPVRQPVASQENVTGQHT